MTTPSAPMRRALERLTGVRLPRPKRGELVTWAGLDLMAQPSSFCRACNGVGHFIFTSGTQVCRCCRGAQRHDVGPPWWEPSWEPAAEQVAAIDYARVTLVLRQRRNGLEWRLLGITPPDACDGGLKRAMEAASVALDVAEERGEWMVVPRGSLEDFGRNTTRAFQRFDRAVRAVGDRIDAAALAMSAPTTRRSRALVRRRCDRPPRSRRDP